MWSDELEEGRLQTLVKSRFKRLARAARKTRPMSKVRPRRKRRFGSAWGLKPAPLFKAMKVKKGSLIGQGNSSPTKGPPTTSAKR